MAWISFPNSVWGNTTPYFMALSPRVLSARLGYPGEDGEDLLVGQRWPALVGVERPGRPGQLSGRDPSVRGRPVASRADPRGADLLPHRGADLSRVAEVHPSRMHTKSTLLPGWAESTKGGGSEFL